MQVWYNIIWNTISNYQKYLFQIILFYMCCTIWNKWCVICNNISNNKGKDCDMILRFYIFF